MQHAASAWVGWARLDRPDRCAIPGAMTLFVVFECRPCGYEALKPWPTCPVCGASDDDTVEHWGDVRRPLPEDAG